MSKPHSELVEEIRLGISHAYTLELFDRLVEQLETLREALEEIRDNAYVDGRYHKIATTALANVSSPAISPPYTAAEQATIDRANEYAERAPAKRDEQFEHDYRMGTTPDE